MTSYTLQCVQAIAAFTAHTFLFSSTSESPPTPTTTPSVPSKLPAQRWTLSEHAHTDDWFQVPVKVGSLIKQHELQTNLEAAASQNTKLKRISPGDLFKGALVQMEDFHVGRGAVPGWPGLTT